MLPACPTCRTPKLSEQGPWPAIFLNSRHPFRTTTLLEAAASAAAQVPLGHCQTLESRRQKAGSRKQQRAHLQGRLHCGGPRAVPRGVRHARFRQLAVGLGRAALSCQTAAAVRLAGDDLDEAEAAPGPFAGVAAQPPVPTLVELVED